jgi:hypothetical protein
MATNQADIVRELMKRRETLDPDKAAIVSELARRFDIQNPQVSAKVSYGEPEVPGAAKQLLQATGDQFVGIGKGMASTAYGVGMMARKYIPGLAWAGDKISDWAQGSHMSDQQLEDWRKENLSPANLAQKVGFGAEQLGEYFFPGAAINKGVKLAEAGTRFAEAVPKLAKLAPMAEYAARGALEAVPAVAIAKAQGAEDTGTIGAMAMAGPTFGKLLNKVGVSKAATGAAKGVTGMVSKSIAEKIPEVAQSPRQMMWRALKPYVRNRDFDQALDKAMPEIYEQAKITKKQIKNVDDFLEVLQATKKRVWAPYAKMIGESADKISGATIADAIEGSVNDYHKTFNKKAVAQVGALAKVYRDKGEISLSDAENWLEVVNAQIKSYYEKYPQARTAIQKSSAQMKAKITEASELRAAINSTIDSMGGVVSAVTKDTYSGKMFKQVYGGLQNLEQEAYRRVNVSKRLAPESLTEQMSKVHAAGEFVWGALRGHPLEAAAALGKGLAYRKAGEILRLRNSSDYLLEQAFKNFGDYVEEAKKAHRIYQGAAGTSAKTPPQSAKITAPNPIKPYTASAPVYENRQPLPIITAANEPAKALQSLAPEVKNMVEDTVQTRMKEAKELFQSGIGALSGKGKTIEGVERMNYGAVDRAEGGFGKIGVKRAIEELAGFKEAPGRIADAIERDKDNPLYLRVKEAVTEATLDRYAPEIEAAQAKTLENSPKLSDIIKGKKRKTQNDDVPF